MSCCQEVSKCDICGEIGPVQRKYYNYDIQCECHSPNHFEMVTYCKNCTPKEPERTRLQLKTNTLKTSSTSEYLLNKLKFEANSNLLLTNKIRTLTDEVKALKAENYNLKARLSTES